MKLLFIVKPISFKDAEEIKEVMLWCGVKIRKEEVRVISDRELSFLNSEFSRGKTTEQSKDSMKSCLPACVMLIEANPKKLKFLVGKVDPLQARPGSLRTVFGHDIKDNAVYYSSSKTAKLEIEAFFPSKRRRKAKVCDEVPNPI